MLVIRARNVNDAYYEGWTLLHERGVLAPSRNGMVRQVLQPVTTHYDRPEETVLFEPGRRANPFFHLFEALWLLAGRNDVAFVAHFNRRMAEYSDDGLVFHGAYGERLGLWRMSTNWVQRAIRELETRPTSRRAVVTLWDNRRDWPMIEHEGGARDVPCNDLVKFDLRNDALNLSVVARSNDMIWGAYGSNVVMFSFLAQYVAAALRRPIGWYQQISLDFHAYTSVLDTLPAPATTGLLNRAPACLYTAGAVDVVPFGDWHAWTDDLHAFFRAVDDGGDPLPRLRTRWWCTVAGPLWAAWTAIRGRVGQETPAGSPAERRGAAMHLLRQTGDARADWVVAAAQWLQAAGA